MAAILDLGIKLAYNATSSLSKSSVFRRPHEYATVSSSKKKHSRERFESCVFGHHFHRRHVDNNRSRNKKVAFYAFVWTGSKVVSSFSQYLATNFLSW